MLITHKENHVELVLNQTSPKKLIVSNDFYTFFTKQDIELENYMSFYAMKNFFKNALLEEYSYKIFKSLQKYESISTDDNGYVMIDSGKQKMKLGKILLNVVSNVKRKVETTDKINNERIVDLYKEYNMASKSITDYKFVVLNGNDIIGGYSRSNYKHNSGMLDRSCMNDKPKRYYELYTKNDNVSLLTLQKDGKIYARALMWKLSNIDNIYIDRIYATDNHIKEFVLQYARKNNWLYRSTTTSNNYNVFFPYKGVYNVKQAEDFKLTVDIEFKSCGLYPYMDSLYIIDYKNNKLSNHIPKGIVNRYGYLQSLNEPSLYFNVLGIGSKINKSKLY